MIQLIVLLLIALGRPLPAGPSLAPADEGVTFRIKNLGVWVDGSFSDVQTDIRFDPARPAESTLAASVGVASIRTGIGLRDQHLQKRAYFDAARYPRIRMVARQLQKKRPDHYVGRFALTIRNVTREIEVPFTYAFQDGKQRFVGQFTLNRLDYGVGGKSLTLGDEVTVFLNVTAPAAEVVSRR